MNAHLIDTYALKKIGFTNTNVEDNIIATTLTRVQDTMLLPILGTQFFKRLLTGVDSNNLTQDEIDLLNDYISPFLVAAVDMRIINHLTYEIRSKTAGTSRDENMNPLSISENLMLSDDLRKDVEVYKQRLFGFLKDNRTLFTDYNDYICNFENIAPAKGTARTNIRFT